MGLQPLKDGIRSEVRIDFYGNVHKRVRGTDADKRYATEVTVLRELEKRGCPYVPKLLEEHPDELYFVTTNCGKIADQISKEKADKLFAKLEKEYGVRHLDAEPRNITYSEKLGCFCIIDFELAEILPPPPDMPAPPVPPAT
jgi:molybdopterin converting factor small subunit